MAAVSGAKPEFSDPAFPNLPSGAEPFRRRLVSGCGTYVLVEELQPNSLARHAHSQWQVLISSDRAAFDITCNAPPRGRKTAFRVVEGQVWLLPPLWPHSVSWSGTTKAIVIYADADNVEQYFPQISRKPSVYSLSQYVAAVPEIADLVLELSRFSVEPNGPTDWHVAGVGSHLCVLILEAHTMLTDGVFKHPSTLVTKILTALTGHLSEHSSDRVPIAQISRRLGISPRHLRRVFREATGKSPQEWVLFNRASRAKKLLLNGRTIKETVEAVGFTDESHLYRVIRYFYGVPPGSFRRGGG